jgi:hypothetical protein
VNFTREPIIETVISPREGNRLVVRNSKGVSQEDYSVEAVEIISFGTALFFRSTERPKAFLVPVSDYEVIELKETRMVLKSASLEKTIKIGKPQPMPPIEKEPLPPPVEVAPKEEIHPKREPSKDEKRRDKKKRRMQRFQQDIKEEKEGAQSVDVSPEMPQSPLPSVDEKPLEEKIESSPGVLRKLFPPPSILIKEKLSRFKRKEDIDELLSDEREEEKESFVKSSQEDFSKEDVHEAMEKETLSSEVEKKHEEKVEKEEEKSEDFSHDEDSEE